MRITLLRIMSGHGFIVDDLDAIVERTRKNLPLPFLDSPGGKEIGKIVSVEREGHDRIVGEVVLHDGVVPPKLIPDITDKPIS